MSMISEQIEQLRVLQKELFRSEKVISSLVVSHAIDTIETLSAKVRANNLHCGWIPCSERLPKDCEDVLVWFEYYRYGNYNKMYKTIGISYTYVGEWSGFINGTSGWKNSRVIAWMPLPEPYTEQTKG